MLKDDKIRDLLRSGYEVSDDDFILHPQEQMSRTVYLMAQLLAERQFRYMSSVELQRQIDAQIGNVGSTKRFNPVDWFSEQWTLAQSGRATTNYFADEYLDLFDREGKNPTHYRIKPPIHETVVTILSELLGTDAGIVPDLSVLAGELDQEGFFSPPSQEEARIRQLRAVAIREGQPQFRAALLTLYQARCAITDCDAVPALEAAHIKPYEGTVTNVVTNGILLRADIHTLFDFDLIGINPDGRRVSVSKQLHNTVYEKLNGTPLRGPHDPSAAPNSAALIWRWQRFSCNCNNTLTPPGNRWLPVV